MRNHPTAHRGEYHLAWYLPHLQERAALAGLAKALPELRPALTMPAWSRAVISPGTRLQMVRAGGA